MNALTLTTIDNEPRVLDTALAEQLGMARPTNIRNVIAQHKDELEAFGMIAFGECGHRPMPNGGTAPVLGYALNRQQALLICILSRTERAKEVRPVNGRVAAWMLLRPSWEDPVSSKRSYQHAC